MKNAADSSFQTLPIVDSEQNVLTLSRYLAAADLCLKLVALTSVSAGAVGTLLFGIAAVLPLATTVLVWSMLRGPLLASFSVLAAGVTAGVLLGPVAGLLAAIIFWVSFLSALRA